MKTKIHLKHLISIAVAVAFLFSFFINILTNYEWNSKLLQENALETNRIYASKLAQVVDLYIEDTLDLLEHNAPDFSALIDDEEQLQREAKKLLHMDSTFNSVSVLTKEGKFIAAAPRSVGAKLKTSVALPKEEQKIVNLRTPYVSKLHTGKSGREIIVISYPLFSVQKEYLGVLAVTIYIHDETNAFHTILGDHYNKNGSTVYAVDNEGRIIYHAHQEKLDQIITEKRLIQKTMEEKEGTLRMKEEDGTEMLVGFSASRLTSWVIIAQTPLELATEPTADLVRQMILLELPFLIVGFLIVLFLAAQIVKPLRQLAQMTEDSVEEKALLQLHGLKAWYYEVWQIKRALQMSFTFLHEKVNYLTDQSVIDPLTKLFNRRVLDERMNYFTEHQQSYVTVMIDIDRFKSVNDTYGHAVGDEVLKFLAHEMRQGVRPQDIVGRFGGEEFTILMPDMSVEEAFSMIDSLRQNVANTTSPCGKVITFSAGISVFPQLGSNPIEVIELADKALYKAKNNGRNCVHVAKQ